MKIRKLQLKNIGVFDDETIEFHPCPTKDKAEIYIFTGQNGSGKSTILQALVCAFDFVPSPHQSESETARKNLIREVSELSHTSSTNRNYIDKKQEQFFRKFERFLEAEEKEKSSEYFNNKNLSDFVKKLHNLHISSSHNTYRQNEKHSKAIIDIGTNHTLTLFGGVVA